MKKDNKWWSDYKAHNALVDAWRGKRIDNDGMYGFQCVDWCKFYAKKRGWTWTTHGNAKDYIKRGLGKGWVWIANDKPWKVPRVGDIVIWDYGKYGHIAVANALSTPTLLRVTDQNGAW